MDSRPARRGSVRRRSSAAALMLAFATSVLAVGEPAVGLTATRAGGGSTRPVIAIVERGMNVLHEDFVVPGGGDVRLPRGAPKAIPVTLPKAGTFEERLKAAEQGVLGAMEPGALYYVRGTRVFVYSPRPGGNVFADRSHGTGVASAAVGLKHGTNPEGLLVIVVDSGPSGWEWLAEQRWIDAVSTSYITILNGGSMCPEVPFIRDIIDKGRLVFTAVGNGEQAGEVGSPSGVPPAYQVGGVDPDGRTYLPRADGYVSTSNRPYETGDRFQFKAADSESLSGSMDFGGTSGATPSTAGRATELLQYARKILGSSFTGARRGLLARAEGGPRLPKKGPLADGDLTAAELTDLLHRIAKPMEPASPVRYLAEGFGTLNADGVLALGRSVLSGTAEMPERAEEQRMHEQVEKAREAAFFDGRCP